MFADIWGATDTYQSHFGQFQWWHAMAYEGSTGAGIQRQIVDLVVENAGKARAASSAETAGDVFGKALHTIQDSYVQSHAARNEQWEIYQFQDYRAQDPDLHRKAEHKGSHYNKAVEATTSLLNLVFCKKADAAAIREFVDKEIVRLQPGKDVPAGGTLSQYGPGGNGHD